MSRFFDMIQENGFWYLIKSIAYRPVVLCCRKYYERFGRIKDNKVLFVPNMATTDSDNALVLYQYLRKEAQPSGFDYVLLVKKNDVVDPQDIDESNTAVVRQDTFAHGGMTLRAIREIATSRYIFFSNSSPARNVKMKRGQIIINLWHGSGYKDIQNSDSKWINGQHFDYVLVPGDVFVETKKKFFSCEREQIWPIGYPRYDIFRRDNSSERRVFEERFQTEGYKKVVWMPTFRKPSSKAYCPEAEISYSFDLPLLKNEDEMAELDELCRSNHVKLFIKRHPVQREYQCERKRYSNIVFLSNEDLKSMGISLYSFLTVTDALISDYSSVAIDYMLLNKPMAFALDDFEDYKATRGFVFEDPLKYMPGHHLYCLDDMRVFLDDVAHDVDRYAAERAAIMPEVHTLSDQYCACVWDKVRKIHRG